MGSPGHAPQKLVSLVEKFEPVLSRDRLPGLCLPAVLHVVVTLPVSVLALLVGPLVLGLLLTQVIIRVSAGRGVARSRRGRG